MRGPAVSGRPAAPRRSWGGILAVLGILAITLSTFAADLFVGEPSENDAPRRLVINASFPSSGPDAQPTPVTIGKGRQVLVRVFRASCASCVRELSQLGEIAGEHETELVSIAVGAGTAAQAVAGPGASVIADPNGDLADRMGVEEPPMTLIVRADGTVFARRPQIATADVADLLDRARSFSKSGSA